MHAEIMLLEDDFFLRDGLHELLTGEGYAVRTAENCREGRALLRDFPFDLVILDVMLPDGSGRELCAELRGRKNDVPILFLTACDEEEQIVAGLDAGADDYVTKPFKMQEFLSRVRALLRRRRTPEVRQKLQLDFESMTAARDGKALALTPTEFQILRTLTENRGIVVTRNALLERIWDCDGNFIDDNTLSVHISRLRDKIGAGHIVTVRGSGYRWEDEKT